MNNTLKLANQVCRIVKTLQLQNDYFNTVPIPERHSHLRYDFSRLERALPNIIELNEDSMHELDQIACELFNMSFEENDKEKTVL